MRSIGIGLAVTLILSALAPQGALAAKVEITKEARAKGMAAAPGLIAAAHLDCQVADARLVGEGTDPKTKQKESLYELACTGNEGMVLQQAGSGTPGAFTCEQMGEPGPDGKASSAACALPGNADPKAGLQPYIAKAGTPCALDKVRAIGQSPTNVVFEVACHDTPGGFILMISAPPRLDQPATMNPCFGYPDDSNLACKLTDRAAQTAAVDGLMHQAAKPCTVKDRRFVGATDSHKVYYEFACQEGKGYIVEQAANGAFSKAIDCVEADAIAGGCTLTDTRQAKTEQAGLYSKLAKSAGFNCDVSGYAPLPVSEDGREVVELVCSNRPDGGIGLFAATSAKPSYVFDCAHAELKGFRCTLSKPDAAYPHLTDELKGLGKSSCTVSNSRVVGVTEQGEGYVEVACSDGLPGYMIDYAMSPFKPKTTVPCSEAKGISGGCTLPGNKKG